MSRRWIALLAVALLFALAPACGTPGGGQASDGQHDAAAIEGKEPRPDTAATALRWGSWILILAGVGIVAARFLGALTAPLIGGILTSGAGIAFATLADLLARHWWLGIVILGALIALALIEWANDRDLLKRDPSSLLPGVLSPASGSGA